MKIKKICCIGAGYVGGPTMAVIALKCPNLNITVVDVNPEKIKSWNGPLDKLPVFEKGLSEIVKKVRNKNLFFSNDIKSNIENSEMIFVAVNTPTKTNGEGAGMAADLSHVESCAKDIAKYSKSNKIIIEKSTLPVRTAEKIKEILVSENPRIKFEILSNPEFLAEGTAIQDLFKSDRVLIGGDNTAEGLKAVKSLVDIYSQWIPKEKIITTNVWSSELSKLASNAMLAQRISSINSLSSLCEKTGANIHELSKVIGLDNRIGPKFLKVSVGFGGSCFQKDILNLVYLSKFYGLNEVAEYWHQVVKINDYQKNRFTDKIISEFNSDIKNLQISVLGWAFKPNTNDTRESPSIDVSAKLLERGAYLSVHDPKVQLIKVKSDLEKYFLSKSYSIKKTSYFLNRIKCITLGNLNNQNLDAIVITTAHDCYKKLDWDQLKLKAKVFDGYGVISNNDKIFSIGIQ